VEAHQREAGGALRHGEGDGGEDHIQQPLHSVVFGNDVAQSLYICGEAHVYQDGAYQHSRPIGKNPHARHQPAYPREDFGKLHIHVTSSPPL
jgi:hypothetical protein